jgi:hypothetical protein
MVVFFDGLGDEGSHIMICNECETVKHCTKHGCIPKQPAPVQGPDWKAEYLKSVESGCITLDELREALAELEATNRQVEILSDALAESRREVAALKAAPVQPVAQWQKRHPARTAGKWENTNEHDAKWWRDKAQGWDIRALYTTPPAQEFTCSTGLCHYKGMENITVSRDKVEQWLEDLEYSNSDKDVIAAIEQALAAPVQEPVATLFGSLPVYDTPLAAQPAVPDAITDDSESPEYRTGWNDCRAEMLKGMK